MSNDNQTSERLGVRRSVGHWTASQRRRQRRRWSGFRQRRSRARRRARECRGAKNARLRMMRSVETAEQWGPTPTGGARTSSPGSTTLRTTAGTAYQELTTRHGYKEDEISVVMSDDTRKRHFGDVKPGQEFKEEFAKAAEGAGIGGRLATRSWRSARCAGGSGDGNRHPRPRSRRRGPDRGSNRRRRRRRRDRNTHRSLHRCRNSGESRRRVPERGLKDGGIIIGTRAKNDAQASEL